MYNPSKRTILVNTGKGFQLKQADFSRWLRHGAQADAQSFYGWPHNFLEECVRTSTHTLVATPGFVE